MHDEGVWEVVHWRGCWMEALTIWNRTSYRKMLGLHLQHNNEEMTRQSEGKGHPDESSPSQWPQHLSSSHASAAMLCSHLL